MITKRLDLRTVVQSWVSANPAGLKFSMVIYFLCLYTFVYFKTSGVGCTK